MMINGFTDSLNDAVENDMEMLMKYGPTLNEVLTSRYVDNSQKSPGLPPNGVLDNKQLNPYQSLAFLAT